LLFLYNTGARVSEALAVRPRELRLAHVYFFGCKLLKAYEPFWPLVTT
jgi:integrase